MGCARTAELAGYYSLQWDDEKLRAINKQQILRVRVREPHWYLMKRPLSPAVER